MQSYFKHILTPDDRFGLQNMFDNVQLDKWQLSLNFDKCVTVSYGRYKPAVQVKQESPADAVKPARRKSMQKLLQFDVFRFISPNSISPNFKV